MYASGARKRLISYGSLKYLSRYQKRYIQVVYNEFSNKQSEPLKGSRNSKSASLKFNPSDISTDFTSFGILPFLQEKLNHLLLPKQDHFTSAPDFNVLPTHDQRTLLSVLNSDHSLIHRGAAQSGKSVGLITYALNHALSKVPNFGVMKKSKSSIDSVILVPTDLLLDKYQYYITQLIKDIPDICCPDQLVVDDKQSDSYIVTRKPLTVKFIHSDNSHNTICTSSEEEHQYHIPQILITTPTRLYEMIECNETLQHVNIKDCLSEVRFFAVDDIDFILNNTAISKPENYNLIRSGKKSKYMDLIEKVIREIQAIQVDDFSSNLTNRLKYVEKSHRILNKDSFSTNKFDHVRFILEDNSLSIGDVDALIEDRFGDALKTLKPDGSLLKRLIKVKRKVLYKPIQYCFIAQPKHSYQQILVQMSNRKYKDKFNQTIMQQLQQIQRSEKVENRLQEAYGKYLLERITRSDQKQEDLQVSYIEKLIRFDDSKRFYRKSERKLLTVGSFNFDAKQGNNLLNENLNEEDSQIRAHFVEATNITNSNNINLKDIEITKNLPDKAKTLKVFENDIQTSGYNIKNHLKDFLKFRMLSKTRSLQYKTATKKLHKKEELNIKNIIQISIARFREEYPLNQMPMMFVVPPYVDISLISDELNKKKDSLDSFSNISDFRNIETLSGKSMVDFLKLRNFFVSQSPRENDPRTNLIIHPSQMVGQNFDGLTNIVVIGIDSILPQLAMSPWDLDKYDDNIKNITGIEDPVSDLLYFYLFKLSSSSCSKVKNFSFVLDTIDDHENNITTSRIEADIQRLSQLILYNDLNGNVNISSLCEDSSKDKRELNYGIDNAFVERLAKFKFTKNCT